jgi:hypothetical protein
MNFQQATKDDLDFGYDIPTKFPCGAPSFKLAVPNLWTVLGYPADTEDGVACEITVTALDKAGNGEMWANAGFSGVKQGKIMAFILDKALTNASYAAGKAVLEVLGFQYLGDYGDGLEKSTTYQNYC